jgi:hypothetical protein
MLEVELRLRRDKLEARGPGARERLRCSLQAVKGVRSIAG